MLSPIVVPKELLITVASTKDTSGHSAYRPKGCSTSEVGLEWLRNFNAETTPLAALSTKFQATT